MNMSLLTCAAGCAALVMVGHPDEDGKHKDKRKHRDHGKEVTQTYDFKGFDRINVSGVYDLDVRVGEKFSVELRGHEREMSQVEVRLKGSALELGRKEKRGKWNKGRHHGVDAVVTLPALEAMKISGVVDGEVKGVDAERFEIKVSGVGDLDISGKCDSLDADLSGVGDLEAKDLRCKDVDVTVSGVGDAEVYASRAVDAAVSGMGDITVHGKPSDVNQSSSMFSQVTIR